MSLFIGNIASAVPQKDLEETFGKYGKCEINYKGAFAFAEYESDKNAEQAKVELQNKEICGRILNIEWSKKSKYYEDKHRSDISPRGKCYTCGRTGHYARDCPDRRRRSSSRRRYHSRRRYRSSRSRSHRHHRRRYSHSSRSSYSRSSRKNRGHRRYRKREGSRSRSRSQYNRKSRERERDTEKEDSRRSRAGKSSRSSWSRSEKSRSVDSREDEIKKDDKNFSINNNENDKIQK